MAITTLSPGDNDDEDVLRKYQNMASHGKNHKSHHFFISSDGYNESPFKTYSAKEYRKELKQILDKKEADKKQKKSDELDLRIQKLQKDLDKASNESKLRMDEISLEVDKQRSKELGVLAIFGALFTFVTVQIQQLSNSNKETAVFVGILALGGLLLFCGVIILASTYRQWWKKICASVVIVGALLILGCGWQAFDGYLKSQDSCTYLKRRIAASTAANDKPDAAKELENTYRLICK